MLKITNISEKPVNESPKVEKSLKANQINVRDFRGELSSTTGIQSKNLYISKIGGFDCESQTPIINIVGDGEFHPDCYKVKTDNTKRNVIVGRYGDTYLKVRSFVPIEMLDDKVEEPYFRIEKSE